MVIAKLNCIQKTSKAKHNCRMYESEDNAIIIQIRKYADKAVRAEYQKDDEQQEVYFYNDIEHYVMTNMGSYRAVWTNGLCEVGISGLESKEELKKMIDSIYER